MLTKKPKAAGACLPSCEPSTRSGSVRVPHLRMKTGLSHRQSHLAISALPQKRTLVERLEMSAKCQKRTFASFTSRPRPASSLLRNVRVGDHRAPFGDVRTHALIKFAGR